MLTDVWWKPMLAVDVMFFLFLAFQLGACLQRLDRIKRAFNILLSRGGWPDAPPMPGDAAKKPKTPEELDEEALREAEAKLKELLALMGDGHTRPKADDRLEKARAKRALHKGDDGATYHKPGGKGRPVAVDRDTASLLELAEALELRIRVGDHALDLHTSLGTCVAQKVEVLERKLKRARH